MITAQRLLLSTTALGGALLLAAGPAAAQQAPADQVATLVAQTDNGGASASDAVDVEALVVTGSRLRRNAYTAPDPLTVITSDEMALQGVASTADALQQSSLAAGSFQTNDQLTGYVTNGGPGTQTVSLRGLGDQRTLVIVNGRRVGPAGTRGTVGPMDLNVIPASAIDRVEILKDGASSIYGSDAVAGVVNIVLKNRTDALTLDAYGNNTEHGGGANYRLSGNWGKTFERGYINVAGEYYRQEPLRRAQRNDTSCAADYLFSADGKTRVDFTDVTDNGGFFYKCYNLSNNYVATNAGSLVYRQPGVDYPTAAEGNNVPAALADTFARMARAGFPATFPYANYESKDWLNASVVSPSERFAVLANGAFELSDNVEAYGQVLFNRRETEQYSARQLFPTIDPANPNVALLADAGQTTIQPVIALPSNQGQDVDYYHAVAGLRGNAGDVGFVKNLSWDIYGSYSLSDATYWQDIIYNDRVVATTGAAACDPNPAGGNISGFSCATLPNGIPWISQRILAGDFTDAERAFLFGRDGGSTKYEQYYVEGVVQGDIFELPAGTVTALAGFHLRHESIDDNPGVNIANSNLWGSTSSGRTKGSDEVREVFGELSVPLLSDLPFVDSLTFDGSARYTDYKSYGGNETYKVGLNWAVNNDIRFRGTYGTSFRAPALYELYLANQTSYSGQTVVDPCVRWEDETNAQIQANCASQGIPSNYTGTSPNFGGGSALITTGGGKGILEAETSKALSVGVILTPQFVKPWFDLSIAVDYFDLKINDEVRRFGAANIVEQCYKAADFPNSAYCGLFSRDLDPASPSYLNITDINNSYVNVADQRHKGIDLNVQVVKDFGDYGRLSIDGEFTWKLKDVTTLIGGTEPEDYNGTTFNYGGPDFSGAINTRYTLRDWSVNWGVTLIGKASDTEVEEGDVFYSSRYGQDVYYKQYAEFTAYHNLSVRKRLEEQNAFVQVGVQNVFDERPPAQSTNQFRVGTAALNGYDMLGRRFYVNVSKTW